MRLVRAGAKGETLLFTTRKTGCNNVMSGSETNTALGDGEQEDA